MCIIDIFDNYLITGHQMGAVNIVAGLLLSHFDCTINKQNQLLNMLYTLILIIKKMTDNENLIITHLKYYIRIYQLYFLCEWNEER